MNIELRNVKGTSDFLPKEQKVRNKITDILRKNFENYGYMPIETPILNNMGLLKYKYSDDAEIVREIYKLSDLAERDLGLRYDLTVPFCKVIGLNKDLIMPFRRYEIGRVFRNGPVKLGRTREFYQCDVDVVGIDGRLIEIEQMQMVIKIFNELGIDILIKWNNRKLMVGLLESLNIDKNNIDKVIGLIDRLAKITKKELIEEFEKIKIDEQMVDAILDLFNKTLDEYKTQFETTEIVNLKEGLEECLEIQKYIDCLELNNNTCFSSTLARGLGIYTNTVFEFFDKENRISSSLGGGGRYNKIITEFMDNGQQYPAVGLSFGLEPIFVVLNNEIKDNAVDVLIIPMDTEIECLKLAESLRSDNIKVLVELGKRKVKKAFDFANKTGIKYVIVVGSNEVESGLFAIKDLETSNQQNLNIDQIKALLRK